MLQKEMETRCSHQNIYTLSLNRAASWIFESVKSWLTPTFLFIAREKKASLVLQELALKENQVPQDSQDKLDPR